MPTLKDILDNAQLADTTEFQIGDSKVTIGEMRTLRTAIDSEKRLAAMERKKAEDLANEAATLLAGLTEQGKRTPTKPADPNAYDWKTDPLYAPVVGELQSILKKAEAAEAAAIATQKSLEQTASVYAYERMRAQYDRLGYKDKSFEDLAQQAIASKTYDRFGLPTLDPIIERLTEPTRLKSAADAAVADARKQWEAERNAAAAAPGATSGASARFQTKKSGESPVKHIEDITSEMVAADPDVQAAMRGEAPIQ